MSITEILPHKVLEPPENQSTSAMAGQTQHPTPNKIGRIKKRGSFSPFIFLYINLKEKEKPTMEQVRKIGLKKSRKAEKAPDLNNILKGM